MSLACILYTIVLYITIHILNCQPLSHSRVFVSIIDLAVLCTLVDKRCTRSPFSSENMPLARMYDVMNLAITQSMALWAWCENVLQA